jgi:predicted kinase
MSSNQAVLHLLCGKIAAGKSTLAAELGRQPGTILVSEDAWLAALYPGEIASLAGYVRCSARLRKPMEPHLIALLQAGLSVVLDFPANTIASRRWMRGLFEKSGAKHQLHHLDVPDELCRARLRARNAGGRQAPVSDTLFDLVTSYFVAPTPDERFNLVVHRP